MKKFRATFCVKKFTKDEQESLLNKLKELDISVTGQVTKYTSSTFVVSGVCSLKNITQTELVHFIICKKFSKKNIISKWCSQGVFIEYNDSINPYSYKV